MSQIQIPENWKISENEVTPESAFMDRRKFLKGVSNLALYGTALYAGCNPSSKPPDDVTKLSKIETIIYPAKKNPKFILDRALTAEKVAASYNNFYEFADNKEDPRYYAQNLKIRPWSIEITGLVQKPQVFDIDDLCKLMPIEERIYKLRCVEAWAMVVPWTGFTLKTLLEKVQPMRKATHVSFTTFHRPLTAQGQLLFWRPWPYTEGLTLKEAMNDLSFMAIGIYGHPLPKQHGAPIRLVVPWKYGYKSTKSIVKIELLDYQPPTFWTTLQSLEYDFNANVNPHVPHPRWSQTKEKMIGTREENFTQLFNGYGDQVSYLYPKGYMNLP